MQHVAGPGPGFGVPDPLGAPDPLGQPGLDPLGAAPYEGDEITLGGLPTPEDAPLS
jgi:hypothetical protein